MAEKFIPCSVVDCNGNASHGARGRKGLCCSHYGRLRRHGHPEAGGIYRGSVLVFIREVAVPFSGEECLAWPFSRSSNGYGNFNLDGEITSAHRYVCEIAHGVPPTDEHHAAHICGNGHLGCVNPNHLSWKTHAENMADKLVHGTDNRGERHPLAKLSDEDVSTIKSLLGSTKVNEIAERFNVNAATIRSIKKGQSWTHV